MTDQTQLVRTLSEALGISILPKEDQERTIASIGEVLFRKVFMLIQDSLSEDDRDRFMTMLEEGKDLQEMDSFLSEKVPEYSKIFQSALGELGRDFQEARNSADAEYQIYANSIQS